MNWSSIQALLQRDFTSDLRNRYVAGGMVLYVFSSVLLIYFTLLYSGSEVQLVPQVWSMLFWLIVLFSGVNAVANSFFREPEGYFYYHYYTVSPQAFITAKYLYNLFFSWIIAVVTYLIFTLMIPGGPQQPVLFIATLLLGSAAYSFLFTLMSAMAARAAGNATLVAILGFPIVIPLLVFISRLTIAALEQQSIDSPAQQNLLVLAAFNLLLPALGYILFPYIWRD